MIKLCEGGFNSTTTNRIHPKQRAGRWRAAYPLLHGVPDGWELEWNFDSDNDGKNSWHTCRLENGSIDINITYKNRTNALDHDSDDDGLFDGVEMGITEHVWGWTNS